MARKGHMQNRTAPSQPDKLISAKKVATLLGVSASSVHRYQAEGIIPVAQTTPRGHRRWWLSAIMEVVQANQPRSSTPETEVVCRRRR